MEPIDYKRQFRQLYSPAVQPSIIEVPELQFAMVDGYGQPESSESFQASIGALYGTVYTLKFLPKKRPDLDWPAWKIMPLEGLWFTEVQGTLSDHGYSRPPRDDALFTWTLMIALPDFFTGEDVELAKGELRGKGKGSAQLDALRLERFAEGLCVQVMYIGPYDEERETIEAMHAYAMAQGYELHGRHHEIYMGDPRSTAPEKLKTVIRHPVRAAG